MGRNGTNSEADGDSYLASLSDLMVGMLFIFIIMLMAFALSYRSAQESSETKGAESEGQRRALECLLRKNQLLLADMLNDINHSLIDQRVNVAVDTTQGILRMKDSVLFDKGRAELREDGRHAIGLVATQLREKAFCYVGASFRHPSCPKQAQDIIEAIYVEGHTDSDPIRGGVFQSNWDLSTTRAIKTFQEMGRLFPGLFEARNGHDLSLVGVSGYADTRPISPNNIETNKEKNRRIDVRFLLRTPTKDDIDQAIKNSAGGKGKC